MLSFEIMNKRSISVVGIILLLVSVSYIWTAQHRDETTVRKLLGGSPDLKIESAEKVTGGREPVFRGVVLLRTNGGADLCKSLGLNEVDENMRKKGILENIRATFRENFVERPSESYSTYAGTLNTLPFGAEAVLGEKRVYFLFSRF
jgi:hypothetical protein